MIVRKWDEAVRAADEPTFGSYLGAHIAELNYTTNGVATREQALTNAQMLASAPELFAALEALLQQAEAWQVDWEEAANDPSYKPSFTAETVAARAALNAARGDQP